MYEVKTFYDDSHNKIVIEYKNNLLRKYLDLFEELVKIANFPEDTVIESIESNKVSLSIPYVAPEKDRLDGRTKIDEKLGRKIQSTLEAFAKKALNLETKDFEIIPLEGYPIENIKEDVQAAVKERRNFCVVDHMDSYTNFAKGKLSMTQATFDYLSDEYCNIAVAANQGDLDEIYQICKNKLRNVDWM